MVTTATSSETVTMTALTRSRSVRRISRVRAPRNWTSTGVSSFRRSKRRKNLIPSAFAPDTVWPPPCNAVTPAANFKRVSLEEVSAVKLQPVDDLVDYLAFGTHGKPYQIEFGADHGLYRVAIGCVMRRLEHVLGVDGRLHVPRQRPLERTGQHRPVGAIDQNRLTDQRQIAGAGAVFIGFADAFGKRGSDA